MIIVIILITHIIIFDIAVLMYVPVVFATVVPDDDGQRSADEDHGPSRSQTPPTPPVQAEPSQSPPPYSNYLIILVKQTSRQIYPLFSNTLH